MTHNHLLSFVIILFCSIPVFGQTSDSLRIAEEIKRAEFLNSSRYYDSAIHILDSIVLITNREGYEEVYFNTKLTKVVTLQNKKLFAEAEALRKATVEEMGNKLERPHQLFGWAIMLQGGILYDQGQLIECIPIYKKALTEYATLKSAKAYRKQGAINNVLGINHARRAYYDLASEYFYAADSFFTNYVKDPSEIWRVKNNLGNIYLLQAVYGKAVTYFEESVALKRKYLGDEDPSLIPTYNNLSNTYSEMGKHNLALEFEEYAYRIGENRNNETTEEKIFRHTSMALLLIELHDYTKAKEELNKAEKVFTSTSEDLPVHRADLDYQWGFFHQSQKEYERAIPYYESAKERYHAIYGEVNKSLPKALGAIATMYSEMGNVEIATQEYQKSIDVFRKIYGDQYSGLAETYVNISNMYRPLEDFPKALEAIDKAIGAIPGYSQNDTTNYENVQDKGLLLLTFSNKALIYKDRFDDTGNIDDARQSNLYRKLCDSIVDDLQENGVYADHLKTLNALDIMYDNGISLEYSLFLQSNNSENFEGAYNFAEKGKNVLLRQQLNDSEQKKFGSIPKQLIALEQEIKDNISYMRSHLYSLTDATDKSKIDTVRISFYEDRLFVKKRTLDSLKATFKKNYPNYFTTQYGKKQISVKVAQKSLAKNTQIIQYVTTLEDVYIISLTTDKVDFLKIEQSDTLYEQLNKHLKLLYNPSSNISAIQKSGIRLFSMLLEPINALKENLIIVADGQLNLLPFETLSQIDKITSNASYLISNYSINYANSTQDIFTSNNRKLSKNIDLLALASSYTQDNNIEIVDSLREGLGPLKWTVKEAKSLTDSYGGELYLNKEATEGNFKENSKNKDIIHIASHGIVDDAQPMFSRLILEKDPNDSINDGNLYVHELYNMSLDANMVVLSACNTASGQLAKGEGLLNIGRGFFYAGVPSVVMSHWQVDDQSTSILMKDFYHFLSEGQKKSDALRAAKLKFIDEASPNKKHPFYWAAFINMGDDSPIVRKGIETWQVAVSGLLLLLLFLGIRKSRMKRLAIQI